MKWTHNIRNLRDRRRDLRKRQTPQEDKMWFELRDNKLGVKFKRQHSIGGYIVDFFCAKFNLIIEVDGSVHDQPESIKNDLVRDDFLKKMNCQVLRFKNTQIDTDLDAVMREITKYLNV